MILLQRDRKYFGDNFLFLPKRLLKRRGYRVTEAEIEQLAIDTKDLGTGAGYFWLDRINGAAPTRELIERVSSPYLANNSTHAVLEDQTKMAKSSINNDPFNTADFEEFYMPAKCLYWDCPIHRPFQTFLEAWWKEKKLSPRDVLLGAQVDSKHAKLVDYILHAKPILENLKEGMELLNESRKAAYHYDDDDFDDYDEEEDEEEKEKGKES